MTSTPSRVPAGTASRPASGSRVRIAALDGLRAAAVALVFIHHADQDRFPGGFLGVDLFFVLSGYLITTLLLQEYQRYGRVWLTGFYARRALRLTPALLVVIAVAVPLGMLHDAGQPARDGLAALLYVMDLYAPVANVFGGGLAHTWSLAVEEQFYLVWPALLLVALRFRWPLRRVVLAVIAVSIASSAAMLPFFSATMAYRSPFPHVAELAAGVLLAVLVHQDRARLAALASPLVPVAGVALLAYATFTLSHHSLWLYTGGFAAIGLGFAAVVGHVVVAPEGPVARLLSWRPAVWLGERSYGFYLWHYPVVYFLGRHVESRLEVGLLGAAASLALTVLSWRYVEQPFLQRKDRFLPTEPKRPVVAPERVPAYS